MTSNSFCPYCGACQERYYSVDSAAVMLDCSAQYFRNLIRDRKIAYVKIGRMVRIPGNEIDKLLEHHPTMEDRRKTL
ncbi:helix-turn-helix domain-containing protein [Candidatus Neomarinimicrobiota bacterium]